MDTKKSGEFQVTQKNLDETRAELKSDISSVHEKMNSGFEDLRSEIKAVDSKVGSVDAKIATVDAKVDALDSKVESVKSDISGLRSDISNLTAAVHRALALGEEQSTQNKYVLDGHQSLHDRQDRFEKEIREDVAQIKTAINRIDTTN